MLWGLCSRAWYHYQTLYAVDRQALYTNSNSYVGITIAVKNSMSFWTATAQDDLIAVDIRHLIVLQKQPRDLECCSLFRKKAPPASSRHHSLSVYCVLRLSCTVLLNLLLRQLSPRNGLNSKLMPKQGTSTSIYVVWTLRAHSNWQCL